MIWFRPRKVNVWAGGNALGVFSMGYFDGNNNESISGVYTGDINGSSTENLVTFEGATPDSFRAVGALDDVAVQNVVTEAGSAKTKFWYEISG